MTTGEKLFAGACSVVFLLILTVLVNVASSTGNVRHCYLNSGLTTSQYPVASTRYWHVVGFRPWRSDTQVGYASSLDEAVEIANKAGCPLHAEK